MLLESGFLDTALLMFHFKNREQPTLATRPAEAAGLAFASIPKDRDVMINDAGKQAVNRASERLPRGLKL